MTNRKQYSLFLLALIAGMVFDYFFYGKPAGVSYPIFVVMFYTLIYLEIRPLSPWPLLKVNGNWLNPGLLLLIPISLLSLTYLIFSNEVFRILNGLAIPLLIATQTLLMMGLQKHPWYNIKILGDILRLLVPQTLSNLPVPFKTILSLIHNKVDTGKYRTALKVCLGLLISLPLLILVIALLASADIQFNNILLKLPQLFKHVQLGETALHLFWITAVMLYIFSYIWGLVQPGSKPQAVEDPDQPPIERHWKIGINPDEGNRIYLDPVIGATILLTINLVYLLFVAIQFSYFFGGGEQILTSGTTYAQYARRGFVELIIVTVINFSILLGALQFIRMENTLLIRIVKSMLSVLVGCTIVMLLSAYLRLSLYEQTYGYTYIRVLVHAFMIYLAVLLLLAFYRIWQSRITLLKPYIIISLAAYLFINYMNMDVIIASNNIDRYIKTGKIDIHYMGKLSYDAVPQLERLESYEEPFNGIKEHWLREREILLQNEAWPSFNLSKYRALKMMDKHLTRLRNICLFEYKSRNCQILNVRL